MVTTTDGTFLTCVPHAMNGLLTPHHWRWVLVDELGSRYIGPAINDDPALDSLSARISDWWEARKELLHRLPLMSVSR